ncbi:SpoIIE family protein phosphatase [Candidatus Sumerlaeota bacterium]|nr:SpoIIE family protein phosphatase [Candidatus Sumerlaeota bacterium]
MNLVTAVTLVAAFVFAGLALYFQRQLDTLERLHAAYRERREAAQTLLNRIGPIINTALDLDAVIETVATYIVEATQAQSGAVFLLDPEDQTLQARSVVGFFPPLHVAECAGLTRRGYDPEIVKRDRFSVGVGLIGFVAETGNSLLISDAWADPRVPKDAKNFATVDSIVAVPLRIRQNILGVMALVNRRGRRSFSDRDVQTAEHLAEQGALAVDIVRFYRHQAEQQRIRQELLVAKEFQQMLLPREFPKVEGLDIAAFNKSALEVGGDYYDFIWVDPTHLGIAIVDVSGKGIPGALVMAALRSTLRAEAPGDLSPKSVLERINRRILEDTRENVFVTMIYGILDVPNRRLKIVRAGHEPLVSISRSDAEPRLLKPKGIALGLVGDDLFGILEETEMDLIEGETVLFYTDGVIEAINEARDEYGLRRFLETVRSALSRSPREQIDLVLADIQDFTGGIPQQDDITMVSVKVLSGAGEKTAAWEEGAGDSPTGQEPLAKSA